MKSLLHSPAMRQRLRQWRPLYNAVFRRQKDLSRLPSPEDAVADMGARGVFLFSFGRCGTTVFADFLASHPEVTTFGEVLNEDSYYSFFQDFSRRALRWWSFRPDLMRREFYPFLGRLVKRHPGIRCLFDLKIEGLHLIEGNWRLPGPRFDIFDVLKGSTAPIILVERRDLVARHVSGRLAAARGAYHSYHDTAAEPEPFRIDIAHMERMNAEIRAQIALIAEAFADHPKFEIVTYEEMFEPDPATGGNRFSADLVTRVAALLEIAPEGFDAVPQLERMSGGSEKSLILNMDEVEAARARQTPRAA